MSQVLGRRTNRRKFMVRFRERSHTPKLLSIGYYYAKILDFNASCMKVKLSAFKIKSDFFSNDHDILWFNFLDTQEPCIYIQPIKIEFSLNDRL